MSGAALITGGQRGIGLGIAEALLGAGFSPVLAAEVAPADTDVVSALERLGGNARYLRHDLREVGQADALLDRVEREAGPVTCFVANAGVPARSRGDMLDVTPENFDFTLDVNLRGTFFLAQAVARRMTGLAEGPYRSMVFVTSVSAVTVSVERAEYCISKAGASMMAALFAARLAGEGIGVFEIRPGIVATPMTDGVKARYDDLIAGGLVPAGRWGTPEDIGAAVVPLATGQMAFACGAVLPLDGGLSIRRL